jgi:hypothetical protein
MAFGISRKRTETEEEMYRRMLMEQMGEAQYDRTTPRQPLTANQQKALRLGFNPFAPQRGRDSTLPEPGLGRYHIEQADRVLEAMGITRNQAVKGLFSANQKVYDWLRSKLSGAKTGMANFVDEQIGGPRYENPPWPTPPQQPVQQPAPVGAAWQNANRHVRFGSIPGTQNWWQKPMTTATATMGSWWTDRAKQPARPPDLDPFQESAMRTYDAQIKNLAKEGITGKAADYLAKIRMQGSMQGVDTRVVKGPQGWQRFGDWESRNDITAKDIAGAQQRSLNPQTGQWEDYDPSKDILRETPDQTNMRTQLKMQEFADQRLARREERGTVPGQLQDYRKYLELMGTQRDVAGAGTQMAGESVAYRASQAELRRQEKFTDDTAKYVLNSKLRTTEEATKVAAGRASKDVEYQKRFGLIRNAMFGQYRDKIEALERSGKVDALNAVAEQIFLLAYNPTISEKDITEAGRRIFGK